MNNSVTIERIKKMMFGSVYPLYIAKIEKKGRTKEELDQVITWLTGFSQKQIEDPLTKKVRYLDKLVDELAKGKKMDKILRIA